MYIYIVFNPKLIENIFVCVHIYIYTHWEIKTLTLNQKIMKNGKVGKFKENVATYEMKSC